MLSNFYSGLPANQRLNMGRYSLEGNTIHRIFLDRDGQPYFGYDLEVLSDRQSHTIRITVHRPTKLRTFEKLPVPVMLADGDRIQIPVLENPATGVRIVDSYSMALRGGAITEAPRGFQDANVAPAGTLLHLEEPALFHDGNDWGLDRGLSATGPVVWFGIPWRGRFLLSATPRAGYRRLGLADGSTIQLDDGAEHYRLKLQADAIRQPGKWWIWVKREPDFRSGTTSSAVGAEQ
jgi:hypothetical protein